MKKALFVLLILLPTVVCLNGCTDKKSDAVRIYVPDGAPALSVVSVFDKEEIAGKKVEFIVVPSANITSYVLSGEADVAIVPTNAAAIIYNKGNPYRYVAAVTHGNLFIVGRQEVDPSGLRGKVVGVIGQGQVPDLLLRTLLLREGIEFEEGDEASEGKAALYYASDGGVLIPLVMRGKVDFGLLGEPAVSAALDAGAVIAVDMQQALGSYPQAGLIASDGVSDEFLVRLLESISDGFAQEFPDEAQKRIAEHMTAQSETTIKSLTPQTVARCNIRLERDCKARVKSLLNDFFVLEPQSVGGKIPEDDFFRSPQ